ncbi:MAG: hypothetical protein Tsb005_17630 [Gammaproteobacteria bacterium]
MTVYIWTKPKDHPQKLIGIYQDEHEQGDSPDRFLFNKGIYLTDTQMFPQPTIVYKVPKARLLPFDSLATHITATPLVNQRLGNLLKALAPNDIQLFDVKVECVDGELPGYQIINLTHKEAFVDREQSEYTTLNLSGGIKMICIIKHLVVKAGCLATHHLARGEELGVILMSQSLRDAFKQAKITGVWLPTAPEYFRAARGLG